jgi:hypothetical protein
MIMKVAIYLAGSIQKGHEKNDDDHWTDEHRATIQAELGSHEVVFLNPAFRKDDLSDQLSVFGRDMLQVFSSDFVFVDARSRRGLGVGAEMMWAKVNEIPVITWAAKDTHYHKSETTILNVPIKDWIHPFVECLSDAIVPDLKSGAEWVEKHLQSPQLIKDTSTIKSAMRHYRGTQLHHDNPMQELIHFKTEIMERITCLIR